MNDDLISRSRALSIMRNQWTLHGAMNAVRNMPSAERTARWVNGECSNCGEHAPYWCLATTYHESDYCPACGARMEG